MHKVLMSMPCSFSFKMGCASLSFRNEIRFVHISGIARAFIEKCSAFTSQKTVSVAYHLDFVLEEPADRSSAKGLLEFNSGMGKNEEQLAAIFYDFI